MTTTTTAADLELLLVNGPLDLSLEELLDLAIPRGVPADNDFAFTLFHESDGEDSPRAHTSMDCTIDATKLQLTMANDPMPTQESSAGSEPDAVTFAEKTYCMVNTCASRLVCWNATGTGFFILDADAFARDVLPDYFKYRNLSAFVSELTHHGFRKTTRRHKTRAIECLEFRHPHFVRGDVSLLTKIQRRMSSSSVSSSQDEAMASEVEEDGVEEDEGEAGEHMVDLKTEISELKGEVQQTQRLFDKLVATLMTQSTTESPITPTYPHMMHAPPSWMSLPPPHPFGMYGMYPFPPGMHPALFHPTPVGIGAISHPAEPQQDAALSSLDADFDVEADDFMAEFFPMFE